MVPRISRFSFAIACVAALLAAATWGRAEGAAAARPARAGTLDRAFGADGIVAADFGVEPGRGGGEEAVVLADGRFLVRSEAAVGRFLPDGRLDEGFGESGYLVGVGWEGAMASAPDGRLLVAGMTSIPGTEIDVSRFLADGALDRSYGEGGSADLRMPTPTGRVAALLAQPDGGALVVTTAGKEGGRGSIVVARLRSDGELDRAYGANGFAEVPLPDSAGGRPPLRAVSLDDGRLTCALASGSGELLVVRLRADGSLDPGLGGAGMVADNLLADIPVGVATLPDGRIEVVSSTPAVAMLEPDGSPDLSFGAGGRAELPALTGDRASAIALQPDGRTLLAGAVLDPASATPAGFFVARLDAGGSLDPSFGSGGTATAWLQSKPPQWIEAKDVAPLPNGDALVVGHAPPSQGPSTETSIGIATFTTTGIADPGFGEGGLVTARPMTRARDAASDVLAAPAGGAIVTGRAAGKVLLARYSARGRLDAGFPGTAAAAALGGGYYGAGGLSLARYPGGGFLLGTGSEDGAALARFGAGGAPDPGFGDGGVVRPAGLNRIVDLAVTRGGAILAAGFANQPCTALLERFTPSGALDRDFGGGDGAVVIGKPSGPCTGRNLNLATRPDGRILLAGSTDFSFLVEFSADGARNRDFGLPYKQLRRYPRQVSAIALDRRGRILIGARLGRAAGVLRLTPGGLPDRSFGRGGEASHLIGGVDRIADLRVEAGGGILLAGAAYRRGRPAGEGARPLVLRFRPDGDVDPRFGGRGAWAGLAGRVSSLRALALAPGSVLAAGATVRGDTGPDLLVVRLHR